MVERRYYPGVDLLRIVAIFGIVGCHLDLPNMTESALFVKRFTDFNVGVFAALAGFFFFMPSAEGFRQYVSKRTYRLVVPYMIWSLIFIFFSNVFHYMTLGQLDVDLMTWRRLRSAVFWGGATTHLWFLISLFYTQIVLYPIRGKQIPSFLLFIASLVVLLIATFGGNWYFHYPVRLLGFVLLGAWLRSVIASRPNVWQWCVVFVLLSTGLVIMALYDRYLCLQEALVTIPVFLLFAYSNGFGIPHGVLKRVGSLSFVIYLVHPLITIPMREILGRVFPMQNAFVFILDQAVVFCLALLVAVIVDVCSKKVPIMNWMVGRGR